MYRTNYELTMSRTVDDDARNTAADYYRIDTEAWSADEEDE